MGFAPKNVFINEKNIYFSKYLPLKNIILEKNNSLLEIEKKYIFSLFCPGKCQNNSFINKLFITSNFNFGNILVLLNKLIFYCEIIGCKTIILDKKKFWFINHKIQISTKNLSIDVGYYNNSLYLVSNINKLLFSFFKIRPEIRINLIRNEIISNLPKINTSKKCLYIHIRSGDIFSIKPNGFYSQPPLCFYQTILNNYNFTKIHLISMDKKNPVIVKLINQYSNLLYYNDSIKNDISKLLNAYNIIASVSSFLNLIIQMNNNLEFLWDYNIYKTSEKIILYHYDLYKYPNRNFTIFRMEPSSRYSRKMYIWKNNKIQRKLMIKEKCENYFSLINKEI